MHPQAMSRNAWLFLRYRVGRSAYGQLQIHTKFLRPATYGETLQIHTSIEEWREKVFVQQHLGWRGDDLLCEGRETRAFVIHPPGEPDHIKAIPVPPDIKARCS